MYSLHTRSCPWSPPSGPQWCLGLIRPKQDMVHARLYHGKSLGCAGKHMCCGSQIGQEGHCMWNSLAGGMQERSQTSQSRCHTTHGGHCVHTELQTAPAPRCMPQTEPILAILRSTLHMAPANITFSVGAMCNAVPRASTTCGAVQSGQLLRIAQHSGIHTTCPWPNCTAHGTRSICPGFCAVVLTS